MSFDQDEFSKICSLTHTEQGQYWLNGFWKEGAEDYKEEIWNIVHSFIECQLGKKKLYGRRVEQFEEGCDLDEFKSHRILELMGETSTVLALRKRLEKLDIDNNKRMALSEYLLDKYQKTPKALCDAPQGDLDPELLAAAQGACDSAAAALDKAKDEADQAVKAKAAAEQALAEAEAAEAAVKQAEAELQASIDEIEKLEKEKADKIEKYQKIIDDPTKGAVKKGQAVQQKEALLAEDPMPIRKAKITQKAALRKVNKARKKAEEQTRLSTEAAEAAAQAKVEADEAAVAAEQALADAQNELEKLKKKGGTPMGKIWWMERELEEKRKFC